MKIGKYIIKARGLYAKLDKKYRIMITKKDNKSYRKFYKMAGVELNKLSTEEKRQVDCIYGKYGFKYNYETHELYKTATGKFDPLICPEDLFRSTIEYKINNQRMREGWSDKNYMERLVPSANFPNCLVRNINGVFFDKSYAIISKENAINILKKHEAFVIKPSLATGIGRNVKVYHGDDDLLEAFDFYEKNYIVQEIINQHPVIASFNPSSINAIRYNTLRLNDKIYPLSATIKIGIEGSFTDVTPTNNGKGCIIVGIDNNGCLRDCAYYMNGDKMKILPNGVDFKGVRIPGFDKITDMVVKSHEEMGHFGYIGWDITVDKDENPTVIEYNVKFPGILHFQYTNGPIFGSLTEEVLQYISSL